MSSGELAPFVAAVLRDRVVQDLSEENKDLLEENEKLRKQLNAQLEFACVPGPGRLSLLYGHCTHRRAT
jgi:hypothetical protein